MAAGNPASFLSGIHELSAACPPRTAAGAPLPLKRKNPILPGPKPLPYQCSICGKSELGLFAHHPITHLLSLEDPATPKERPAWFRGEHLQLWCHDVESTAESWMLMVTPPTPALVAEILEFGERCLGAARSAPVHVLVHCFAGISRSTAASFALLAQALGAGYAAEALRQVQQLRKEALPNRLIVQYADELLGRGGEMMRALEHLFHNFDPY